MPDSNKSLKRVPKKGALGWTEVETLIENGYRLVSVDESFYYLQATNAYNINLTNSNTYDVVRGSIDIKK